jgi:carbon storage regulator
MLILTRRIGEAIRIGDAIRVIVLSVKGSQVSLGIEAPDNVPLWRAELYERIARGERPGKPKPP